MRRWVLPVLTATFVMAGFFKGTPLLATLPFDLTALLAALTGAAVIVRIVVSPIPPQIHGVIVGFMLLLPAVFFAAPTIYGSDKVTRLFTLTLLSILAPIILIRHAKDVDRYLWAWVAVCTVVVGSALFNPQEGAYTGAPVTAEGIDTIALGDAAGLVLLVVALAVMWKRVPLLSALALGGAATYALLQSGSRGPLIATVLAIIGGMLLPKVRPRAMRATFVVALSLGGLIVAFLAAPYYAQERIASVLRGRVLSEATTRLDLYSVAWQSIGKNPLGIGWGGYEQITFLGYRYPHNLYLEVLVEAGVIFGGLFLFWLAVYFWSARQSATTFASSATFSIFLFMLIEVTVSGDIVSNRMLFYAVGLTIAVRAALYHQTAGTATRSALRLSKRGASRRWRPGEAPDLPTPRGFDDTPETTVLRVPRPIPPHNG